MAFGINVKLKLFKKNIPTFVITGFSIEEVL